MRALNNTIPLCPAEAGHLPQGGENTRQFIGFVSIVEFSPPAKGECPKGEGVNHSVTILLNPDYGFYVITVFNSLH